MRRQRSSFRQQLIVVVVGAIAFSGLALPSAPATPVSGAQATAPPRTAVQNDPRGPGHRPSEAEVAAHEKQKSESPDGRVRPPRATTSTQSLIAAAAATAAGPITSQGPLTSVTVSADLNCAVNYAGDSAGEFYGDTACGTFASIGGVLYGPASVPAGGSASPRTAWTPVSQTGPSGSGTPDDPYVLTTTVDAGTTGVRVTETDTYLPGQNYYRTTVRLENSGGSDASVRLWRAADCYLGDNDSGYGAVNSRAGTIGCRQGSRLIQWQPLTAGSHYYEAGYNEVWAQIGAQQAFPDSCARCTEYADNGAGLSWDVAVPAAGSVAVAHRTNFTTTLPALDLAATFGPDCNCDSLGLTVNRQVRTDRPVNTATGAESESFRDSSYPGPGMPLVMTRFYTSADTTDGPFGVGWTFAYNASLSEDTTTGTVDLRAETGAHAVFTRNGDGTYAAPPAVTSTLTRSASGWTLTAPDGHTLDFGAGGLLQAIKDRSGVGVTVSHDAGGHLTTVTDAAGRTMTFTWTGDRITRLTLADGRFVDYAYTDGRLTSVTDLRGKTTTLAWDPTGRLASVKDPDGNFRFQNTYDPTTGRVTEQIDPLGHRTTFGWDPAREIATRTDARGKTWTEYYAGNVLLERDDPYQNAWLYDYDQRLNLTSVTDPRGNTTTFGYNAQGDVVSEIGPAPSNYTRTWNWDTARHLLTSYVDRNGGTTRYTYTPAGLVDSIQAPDGATTSYSYNDRGQLATRTTPRGEVWRYGYDADGNLTSEQSPLGNTTTYGYDASGRRTSATSPRGNVPGVDPARFTTEWSYNAADQPLAVHRPGGRDLGYGYDDAGNLTSTTDGEGAVWTYAFDAANQPVATTDPLGHRTTLEYDPSGNVSAQETPAGRTTFGYDDAERLVSITSPRGNATGADATAFTTTYTYNAVGLRTSVSHPDPAGGQPLTAFTDYDELNRPVAVTDPLGHVTKTTYDPDSRVTGVTNPVQATVNYELDPVGRTLATTDATGDTTRFEYDADGERTATILPGGQVSRWTYDDDGRVASSVDARGTVAGADPDRFRTRYEYDADGNRTAVHDPLGGTTSTEYDGGGLRTATVDADGGRTTYDYDHNGRVVSVTDPLGHLTSYAYDAAGRLTGRTDARGKVSHYAYDAANRLTAVTTPAGHEYSYGYDGDGNLARVVTALGNAGGNGTITVGYDSLGRRTGLDYSDSTPDESFTYDRGGRLVQVVDGAGTTSLQYDDADRLTRQVRGSDVLAFGYDADGHVTGRTYADGSTATSVYDANGWLSSNTDAAGTTTFGYDAAGHLVTQDTPDGGTATSTWDPAGRLTATSHRSGAGTLAEYTRTLDPLGLPTGQQSTVGGTSTSTAYTYDAAGRLTSECAGDTCAGAGQRTDYSYDPVGNRTRRSVVGANASSTSYSYDDDGRMVSATTGGSTATYEYDANGNQLTSGEPGGTMLRNTFDLANRLTRVQRSGETVAPTGLLAGGSYHSLAAQSDGSVWAFGDNRYGQLGLGDTTSRKNPTKLTSISGARAVAAGGDHSLVLGRDGSVYGFGDNGYGQSADSTDGTATVPRKRSDVTATAVAAGNYHSLAVRPDGTVAAWGLNNAGQLGDGTTTSSKKAVTVSGLAGVTDVAAGGLPGWAGHSLALKSDGTVWAWGYGKYGELGNGAKLSSSTPVKVQGLTGITAIAAAGDSSYALRSDGTVWAWGDNGYGQLGNTGAAKSQATPVQVQVSNAVRIAAGGTHALAVRANGTVWAWGNNNTGQLGDGAACGKTCTVPVRAGTISTAVAVGAGYVHSLAARQDGSALAWGRGSEGELGNGGTAVATSPTVISTLNDVRPGGANVDTTYTYDAAGLRATASTGSDTTHYTWDTTGGLPTLLSDGSADYSYTQSRSPVSSRAGAGGAQYFHTDPLGSVRMTTGAGGSTTSTTSYDAFGNLTAGTGTAPAFGFAGQATDPSGLQYLRARYYDPSSGRFLSADPVAPQLSDPYVSSYVYANGNPTTFTDPSGQCLVVCAIVGAAVGALVGGVAYAVTTDDFSWGGLAGAAGTGAVVGGVIGFTGGLGIAAGGAVAEGLGLGVAGTIGATAVGGAVGTAVGHYGINTALGVPYTGTDAVIDVATGGLAGGFSGALSGLSRLNQLSAAAEECLGASTVEQKALQIALEDGRVKPTAPTNHLNGAMAEELGWESAADAGQIGIMGPGKITAVGPDFITYDPSTFEIVVWDAKYSSGGRFPTGQIPASKLSSWSSFITDAVNNYSGPNAAAVKQALANNSIRGDYFTYP